MNIKGGAILFDVLMAKNGLKGKKVAILRSMDQSSQLAEAIKRSGGVPIFAPSIEITLDYDLQVMERTFRDLSNGSIDYLIFTSSNGVRSFYQIAAAQGRDLGIGDNLKIIAVGPWTSDALASHGVRNVIIPKAYNSAGILDLLGNLEITGKRIALLRGSRSDDTLPSRLEARGARVDSVVIYRTKLSDSKELRELIELIRLGRIDIILFTSPSTVRSLLSSASRLGSDSRILDKVVVAAIGPVTGNYLREREVQVKVESDTFEIYGLLDSLARYLER